jgi:hypothetical protein
MRIAVLMTCCVLSASAYADEPLRPPTFQRFSSPNREVVAYATPGADTRVVNSASGEVLWRIPRWTRLLYLSNDGAHAAEVYSGLNLIPLDSTLDFVLVTLWTRGEKSGEVTLRELVASMSVVPRTVSHLYWGRVNGFADNNELIVERFDGKVFRFTTDGTPR